MKKIYILVGCLFLTMSGCIVIENDPFLLVDPVLEFYAHIRKDSLYVTSTVNANPTFVDPGNIPTVITYKGDLEIYNEETGLLLGSAQITGDGLNTLVEASALFENFEHIIVIATGIVSAYADKGSDGDSSNDIFIHESDFYELVYLNDLLNLEGYPVVTMDPEIDYQTYFSNHQLVTTATISANPDYIVAGNIPVIFDYEGVMQVTDQETGALLKSTTIDDEGLSIAVSILADTVSYNNFVIHVSGTLTARADLGSDGDPSNDLFVASTEFNDVINVDLNQF